MGEIQIYDRVALKYHEEVVTPFASEVEFRLDEDIDALLGGWAREKTLHRRIAIDFGCGIGEATALIASRLGLSAALDFSAGMLSQTRRRLSRAGHRVERVERLRDLRRRIAGVRGGNAGCSGQNVLVKGNFLRMKTLSRACDLALAINSIAGTTKARTYEMFENVMNCLVTGGQFIGVFPAFDAMVHLLRLHQKANFDDGLLERLDFVDGVYCDEDALDLKCVTRDELERLVAASGLETLRLEKIRYPWSMMRRCGWGYYPNAPRLWDWYLRARRR